MKNNLISLLDRTFPGVNELFTSPARERDGHEKWIDFVAAFPQRSSLVCFAGIESPENQSGTYNQHSRRISKQGSPHLRRALFQVMQAILQNKNSNEPTFQFLDKKRSEGKPYKVYMIAGVNKFLRIYYARVNECINNPFNSISGHKIVNNITACKQDKNRTPLATINCGRLSEP